MKVINKPIYLSDLHFEQRQWKNELDFWKDELASFQHRLGEVISRWTDKGILAQAEHFQNQFIRQNEVVDQLQHDIREYKNKLSNFAKEHQATIENKHFTGHAKYREGMETQQNIYNGLKKEFFAFLTQTM